MDPSLKKNKNKKRNKQTVRAENNSHVHIPAYAECYSFFRSRDATRKQAGNVKRGKKKRNGGRSK